MAAFANGNDVNDKVGKKTNLRNKDSCWMALISIVPPGANVPAKKEQIKIPNHVIAGAPNESKALSNIFVFIQESKESRQRESLNFSKASPASKKKWGNKINSLTKRRPGHIGANLYGGTDDNPEPPPPRPISM